MGKKKDPALKSPLNRNVTTIEYISLLFSRVGGVFATTLTGTLATAFLHELYFGPAGIKSEGIASILKIQTTITTVAGLLIGLLAGVIVQKWKTKWGRYRQWYIICSIPMLALTVLYFYCPEILTYHAARYVTENGVRTLVYDYSGWGFSNMVLLRYGIALFQTVFNAFNNLGQNLSQVISPNIEEKKKIATFWQIFYYLGYGAAYLATFIYGLFSQDKNAMYMRLALVAGIVTFIGNIMCGLFCRERIELPKKEKISISGALFSLFKYRNYRAYQYIQWANVLAALGKFSTYLAAITVGSSKNLLLTLPTAVGTVVGNLITAKISKKYEPTKLLKFCGVYSMASAFALFGVCFAEAKFNIMFFTGWNSVFFYVFYFLFGLGIGVQELSNSHFNVEYYDYLEWQTGERLEAVQGIIPGWITTGLNYGKDLLIPYLITWIGYESSAVGDLVKTMQAKPDYLNICLWLLGFLVFGYAISNLIKAIVLKFFYDVEGENKAKMYKELESIREKRHQENEGAAPAEAEPSEA